MTEDLRPILGITMGDAAGIGPEIITKAFARHDIFLTCRPLVIGALAVFQDILPISGVDLEIRPVKTVSEAEFSPGRMNVFDLDNIKTSDFIYGRISAAAGRAAGECIETAIGMALAGSIHGLVTAPINKESFFAGGYGRKYAGHTEMLADLTGAREVSMLLAAGNLRVIHVSTHLSLRRALDEILAERIYRTIRTADLACRQLGLKAPKIAVAGLNPHSGEGGLMGDEEINEIQPAIRRAVSEGLNVEGPFPADTIFPRGTAGVYDMIVAMYHDQGHIPVKLHGFHWKDGSWASVRGVNITVGLPIIRTSVDHGTAFGKAGKGTADDGSLIEAVDYAVRLASYRGKKIEGISP
jgi:4-phospho-D-threonate 3-dehydrogenase / 4-phospho-D-erythronate 3-dehydrogenase